MACKTPVLLCACLQCVIYPILKIKYQHIHESKKLSPGWQKSRHAASDQMSEWSDNLKVASDQKSDNHQVIIASDNHLLCSGVLRPIMPRSLQLSLDHSRPAFQRFLATFIITPGPGDQSCEAGSKTRMRGVSRNGWKLQALLLGPSCVERLQHVIPAANVDLCLQLMSWLLPGRWPAPGET